MGLTREAVLNCQDRVTEVVKVPEWGGEINVRSLNGAERDAFEGSRIAVDKKGTIQVRVENIRARLVALAACDDNGARIFTDEDVKALGFKNASALSRVYDVAARLSGITKEDIEDIAKNSKVDEPSTST